MGVKTKTNIESVIRWVFDRDIVLTTEQEQLLMRLQFADEKLRSRKHNREQIINALTAKFGISNWRADHDVTEAQKLFGTTRKINKSYLLAIHLDDIQAQMQLAKTARRFELLPKLNENFIHALNSLPEELKGTSRPPSKIVFIVKKDNESVQKSVEEIIAEAQLLADNSEDYESIDFEDEPGRQDDRN